MQRQRLISHKTQHVAVGLGIVFVNGMNVAAVCSGCWCSFSLIGVSVIGGRISDRRIAGPMACLAVLMPRRRVTAGGELMQGLVVVQGQAGQSADVVVRLWPMCHDAVTGQHGMI